MELYEAMNQFDIETLKKINELERNQGMDNDDLFFLPLTSLASCLNPLMLRKFTGGIIHGEEKMEIMAVIMMTAIMAYNALTENEKEKIMDSVSKSNKLMKKTLEEMIACSEKDNGSYSAETDMVQ